MDQLQYTATEMKKGGERFSLRRARQLQPLSSRQFAERAEGRAGTGAFSKRPRQRLCTRLFFFCLSPLPCGRGLFYCSDKFKIRYNIMRKIK